MRLTFGVLLFTAFINSSVAQAPPKPGSINEIQNGLNRLEVLAKVLYVAAHPDDENTKMLSYFHQQRHARTAYLSLTRGDGGQNLIGPELRDALGLIRTHELLKAREQDGALQYFTRANDFGYSKNSTETFAIWDKEAVLHDMVWVIRQFQPDVVITRFDHRTPGTTHGHHTASAQLTIEALERAADWKQFTEQLVHHKPHTTDYLFYNTSYWAYGGQEAFDLVDKSKWLKMDIGQYFPTRGLSNGEIAAKSRSQHQSQGFGMLGHRGSSLEYLEPISAEAKLVKTDVLQGVDTSWKRVKGGEAIAQSIQLIKNKFNPSAPQEIVTDLVKLYRQIEQIEDKYWREVKLAEVQTLIIACTGLYLEATTTVSQTVPSSTLPVRIELAAQWKTDVMLKGFTTTPASDFTHRMAVKAGESAAHQFQLPLGENTPYTDPYWLKLPHSLGLFQVEDRTQIGQAVIPSPAQIAFHIEVEGLNLTIDREITYKTNDRVIGEVYQPLAITPVVSVELNDAVVFAKTNATIAYKVKVTAQADAVNGAVNLVLPSGWKASPNYAPFELAKKGQSQEVEFELTTSTEATTAEIQAVALVKGKTYDSNVQYIRYGHIPHQMYREKAKGQIHTQPIVFGKQRIAYLMGAGDQVGEYLEKVGYHVDYITAAGLRMEQLNSYDVLILGVRALNVEADLAHRLAVVWEWAKQGKTVILQYNTLDTKMKDWSPYPLTLSRDRITEEDSPVKILEPKHAVFTKPNAISSSDFDHWIQERGLYYPNKWSANWQAVLRMNDTGEKPTDGALLIAPHGKGHIVYTGLSFFRELPAGVAGAYKLFANLLALSDQ